MQTTDYEQINKVQLKENEIKHKNIRIFGSE